MTAPAAPPTAAPMIAPFAVEPFARPTIPPTAAPVAPPMMAPRSFLFNDAQPLETTRPASIGMRTNVRLMDCAPCRRRRSLRQELHHIDVTVPNERAQPCTGRTTAVPSYSTV